MFLICLPICKRPQESVCASAAYGNACPGLFLRDLSDARKKFPLIGIGVEGVVDKDRVALALRPALEWKGYEVAESAFYQRVLGGKEPVVCIEAHGFGQAAC